MKYTRNEFLKLTGVGLTGAAISGMDQPERKDVKFKLGLASYTFRSFSVEDTIKMSLRLGVTSISLKSFHAAVGVLLHQQHGYSKRRMQKNETLVTKFVSQPGLTSVFSNLVSSVDYTAKVKVYKNLYICFYKNEPPIWKSLHGVAGFLSLRRLAHKSWQIVLA